MTKKKWVVVEFLDEFKGFLATLEANNGNPKEFLAVPLQPEVTAFCKSNNIDYTETLNFFNNDSHERALTKSGELAELIAANLSFPWVTSIPHALMNTFLYYSRLYINNFIWIIEVMKGIHSLYGDSEIHTCKHLKKPGSNIAAGVPFFAKKDRYISNIIEKYCAAYKLTCRVVEIKEELPNPVEQSKRNILKHILAKIAGKFLDAKLEKLSTTPVVFFTALSYNLDRLAGEITQLIPGILSVSATSAEPSSRGYLKLLLKGLPEYTPGNAAKGIISIPTALFTGPGKKINRESAQFKQLLQSYRKFIDTHKDAFKYEGCSFVDELNEKVESDLLVHLDQLLIQAAAQERILNKLRPRLLVSPLSVGPDHSWAEVGERVGIPALVIPQKGLVAPANEFAGKEEIYIGKAQVSDDFKYAAAQTKMVREYLEWSGYKGNIIETGNLIFAKARSARANDKQKKTRNLVDTGSSKVIVYAPSMKSRKSRRFFVLETLDELIASIADLVETVAAMPEVLLVIRIHPGEPITAKEIGTLLPLPPNVTISDSGTFEDVLSVADMIVSYSSTSIQEALLNNVPVLLYDKWKRYNHLQAGPCENLPVGKIPAAYYVNEKDMLSNCIRWILEKQEKNEIPENAFREYTFPAETKTHFVNFLESVIIKNPGQYPKQTGHEENEAKKRFD